MTVGARRFGGGNLSGKRGVVVDAERSIDSRSAFSPALSSAWGVEFSPTAVRALDRLPLKIAAAVVEFCTRVLPENPLRMTKPLRYELQRWRVARRGDYRVFVQLHEDDHVLLIGRIEHRAHAYRPRGS